VSQDDGDSLPQDDTPHKAAIASESHFTPAKIFRMTVCTLATPKGTRQALVWDRSAAR